MPSGRDVRVMCGGMLLSQSVASGLLRVLLKDAGLWDTEVLDAAVAAVVAAADTVCPVVACESDRAGPREQ
jgi:hypothetical protein